MICRIVLVLSFIVFVVSPLSNVSIPLAQNYFETTSNMRPIAFRTFLLVSFVLLTLFVVQNGIGVLNVFG